MLSMVIWQTFLEAFNAPLAAIAESKTMLAKINFPREAIILAKFYEIIFNFSIKLILVILLYFIYEVPITWKFIFSFIGIFQMILLGIFLGLLIAPLGAIYQDVSSAVAIGTTFLFLITPVVYPTPVSGLFALIVSMNPVTHLIVVTRELATTGVVTNLNAAILVSIVSFIGFIFTWIAFRLSIPYVIERMPS